MDKNRREFMKLSLLLGAGAVASHTCASTLLAPSVAEASPLKSDQETWVWANCWAHCSCSCLLKVFVKDGVITRIEGDDMGDDKDFHTHQTRACLKGRSLHKRIYAPDRLKYPLRRVGKRGEGKFERISWEEALDEVHSRLSKIIEKYGNDSIFTRVGYGGIPAPYHSVQRFLNMIGGHLTAYNNYSNSQLTDATDVTYGKGQLRSSPTIEVAYSDLIVLFGDNPAVTRMSGGGGTYHYQVGKNISRARTVIVDPRYTSSACGREDQWIPVRPGTDAAMAEAIAYVLITEDLVDKEFLKTHCYGYDGEDGDPANGIPALAPEQCYKAYILGTAPGEKPKTPKWAASICGVPEKTIIQLARDIGNAKAPFIAQGWGIQRQAAGEQNSRAILMLPVLVGKLGMRGTCSGSSSLVSADPAMAKMPMGENKVKGRIACFMWPQAAMRGKEMTALRDGVRGVDKLKSNIKCVFAYQSNWVVNQHGGANQLAELLKDESKIEFLFCMDNHLTPSAKFSDIVFPTITWLEDSRYNAYGTYVVHAEPVIERLFDCPHPYTTFTELAKRFGVEEEFTEGRTWDEWQDHLYLETRKKHPHLPTIEELKAKKAVRLPYDIEKERFLLKEFRQDPIANPLSTPTGKIELYSLKQAERERTWELRPGEKITALPQYTPTWEDYNEANTSEYPLQFISYKPKSRAHSTFGNVPWLREVIQDALSINPIDAEKRGINHGDTIEVFNGRGRIHIEAKVTPRIMPGVVAMQEGNWYDPQANGVDTGRCANTLTRLDGWSAISKANGINTCLVEVKSI